MKLDLEIQVVGVLTFYFFRRFKDLNFFFENFREIKVIIDIPTLASTAARAIINIERVERVDFPVDI